MFSRKERWIRQLEEHAFPLSLASFLVMGIELLRVLSLGGNGFGEVVMGVMGLIGFLSLGLFLLSFVLIHWIKATFKPFSYSQLWTWMLAIGFGGALEIWCVHQATLTYTRRFRQPTYQGLAIGLTACLISLFLILLVPWIVKVLKKGVQIGEQTKERLKSISLFLRLSTASPSYIGKGVFFGGGCFLVWFLDDFLSSSISLFKTLDLRPVQLGLFWVFSWLFFSFTSPLSFFNSSRKRIFLFLQSGFIFFGLGYTAWAMGEIGYRRLVRDTTLAPFVLKSFQKWSDFDGDGQSAWFHGGDCQEGHKRIRSGAYDRVGFDLNCTQTLRSKDDPWASLPPKKKVSKSIHQKSVGLTKASVSTDLTVSPPKHLLLLTIDALRYDTSLTHFPLFRRWIQKHGVDFQNAYSAGASTYWSIPSLIGAKMPSRFKMERDQTPSGSEELLAEVLSSSGFETALFGNVTIFFVRGLRQGIRIPNFETSKYTYHGAKPGSKHLTSSLIRHFKHRKTHPRFQKKKQRLMVWGHYYDLHDPYFEVPQFPSRNSNLERYQSIARSVDIELDRLFTELQKLKLLKETLIVITSDHGDEFLDHGHEYHGKTLYEEMVHVPLWIFDPRLKARSIESVISHVDVSPTLLDLLGARSFKRDAGRSWADWLLKQAKSTSDPPLTPPPSQSAFFEVLPDRNYTHHQVGIRKGSTKVIYDLRSGAFEVYDLKKDPFERVNLGISGLKDSTMKVTLMNYVDQHLAWLAKGESGINRPWGSPAKKRR